MYAIAKGQAREFIQLISGMALPTGITETPLGVFNVDHVNGGTIQLAALDYVQHAGNSRYYTLLAVEYDATFRTVLQPNTALTDPNAPVVAIAKAGVAVTGASGYFDVSFPRPFPSANYSVSFGMEDSGTGIQPVAKYSNVTAAGFRVTVRNSATGQAVAGINVSWVATLHINS